ncbi:MULTISPECIES: S-layer homology domain-containing protein [Lysinibacillus]|uniref:S-layer homology domain-containing protein n=1 Tax=Lysinibacillus TaxID=400634 RepID=UPI00214C0C81|nr:MULTISPECIES: S-layer homology domain-containing protein [Lysinibacillus]UUV25106.1 S-layer homology domain-containing protein [Lysinibacillus sp. FN11]UYB47978.1 S-layer homology domain-containing protein [Lysinibacillus capsici]
MKKLSIFMLLMMLVSLVIWQPQSVYADELSGHMHESGLRYLIQKDALLKDANGSYRPNATVTRGEFATYIAKALNLDTKNEITFTDVSDTYLFANEIKLAATAGIITGYTDGSFKPDDRISREHMAVMLIRAVDYLKIPKGTSSITFKDNTTIFKDFREDVAIGAQLGLIKGSSNGMFLPRDNATIGEASTFILRLILLADQLDAGKNENNGNSENNGNTNNNGNNNNTGNNGNTTAYIVKEVSNGNLVDKQTFTSFEAAEKAMTTSSLVVTQNDKIIKMTSGYVVTNNYVALNSETIKDQIAVAGNTEMEYLGSDATQVKVRLAGHTGYLKQADVTLIPSALVKGRSYYTNEYGEIKHTLYDYKTNKYSASYVYGKAPSFMKQGEKYFSWDGINFTNADGSSKGEAYNYYQFLPARATTQYTADELDQYIVGKLAEVESSGASIYKNATTKSKLLGLGSVLKEVEANSHINAMLILSLAQHESAYGMSDHAQNLNNLFGLYVYDTNPLNKKFESVEANINELVEKFLQPNYITPGGRYTNGAVVGSKAIGFNVKYASDPFWGAKIAGHYYRAEKALGFKDANNPYKIALTTTAGLNVRADASTSQSPLFTFSKSNMPVIVTDTSSNGWYQIVSDKLYTEPGYISKDYIKFINTVK